MTSGHLGFVGVMVLLLYSYAATKTEPVDFHEYMIKFDRFSDDPSNAEIDLLNEKRGRLQSLLLSQPNTKAVLEVLNGQSAIMGMF